MMTDTDDGRDDVTARDVLDDRPPAPDPADESLAGAHESLAGADESLAGADEPAAAAPAVDRRNLGAVAHLSAFVAVVGIPSFAGPLAVWLLYRDRDAWVADQARAALNFNLSLFIYAAAAVLASIVTIGLGLLLTVPAAIVAAIAWLVLTVLAALRAADGERYRYPLTMELIR